MVEILNFLMLDANGLNINLEVIGKHIHHALCGHGGEWVMHIDNKEFMVDGLEPKSKTVYQFNGCKWHRGVPAEEIKEPKQN